MRGLFQIMNGRLDASASANVYPRTVLQMLERLLAVTMIVALILVKEQQFLAVNCDA